MKKEAPNDHGHHIVPIKVYALNLVVLMAFMVLTIFMSGVHLGSLGNNLVAMAIAITKATLVILIFMGVKYSSNVVKIYAALGFVWLPLLGIAFCDYGTRSYEIEKGWEGKTQLAVTSMNAPEVDKNAVKRAHVEAEGGESGEAAAH